MKQIKGLIEELESLSSDWKITTKIKEEDIMDVTTELNGASMSVDIKTIGKEYFITIKKELNPQLDTQQYKSN